jgi:hypothetical protein
MVGSDVYVAVDVKGRVKVQVQVDIKGSMTAFRAVSWRGPAHSLGNLHGTALAADHAHMTVIGWL